MINFFYDWYLQYSREMFGTLFVIIAALSVITMLDVFVKRVLEPLAPTKRAKTLLALILNAVKVSIFIIGVVIALSIFHINITPILASAGIVGLAVGFGSQVLVKDIISGIFFIFENQFNTGDMVQIDAIKGIVESVGLRTTSIRDLQTGALNIIPNGSITKLANLSDRWSNAAIEVGVPIANDVDTIGTLLDKAIAKLLEEEDYAKDILEKPRVHMLDGLADGKMTYGVILKCHPGRQDNIERKLRYLVKKEFDKAKIIWS